MLVNCKSVLGYNFSNDDIMSSYLKEVRRFPLLDNEEERKLLEIYKNGKVEKEREKAKEKLVQANLRFVISIARKLGTSENFHDLISEGNIGLLKAIEKYDLESDCKLTTYAVSWIMVQIQEYKMRVQKIVVPKNIGKLTRFVKNAIDELYAENERKPYYDEIAERIKEKYNYTVVNLDDVSLGANVISVSEKYETGNNETNTVEDGFEFTKSTSKNSVEDYMNSQDASFEVDFFLSKLNERERFIVTRKHGIGCVPQSLDSIGYDLGIGKERTRQIYSASLKKMRKYA